MSQFHPLSIVLLVAALAASGHANAASRSVDYDAMYSRCLQEAGATNNGTVGACSEGVSDRAKEEMNRLYDALHSKLSADAPDDAAKLESSQRAWLTYRNTQCELAGAHVGSPMFSYCPMRLNIARVGELRELLGE